MKSMPARRIYLIYALAAIGTSCTDGNIGGSPDQALPASGAPARGYFLDSAVSGLGFATASRSGLTDADGAFSYEYGEPVRFFIGSPEREATHSWSLGSATAAPRMTPLDLHGTDEIDTSIINTIRLLQSLDANLDPEDGIQIAEIPRNLLHAGLTPDFSSPGNEFFDNPSVIALVRAASDRRHPVDETSAIDHFQSTLNTILEKPLGIWTLSEGRAEGQIITSIDASLRFQDGGRYMAQLRLGDDSAHLAGSYSIVDMVLDTSVETISLQIADQAYSADIPDSDTLSTFLDDAAPVSDVMAIALGIGANIRQLPNSIVLESEDANVVLRYRRGDSIGDVTPSHVAISPDTTSTIFQDETVHLEAHAFTPSSAEVEDISFLWSSSDPTVATVTGSGLVTAIGVGRAVITASYSGVNATHDLEVIKLVADPPEPTPDQPVVTAEPPAPASPGTAPDDIEADPAPEPVDTPVEDDERSCEAVSVDSVSQTNSAFIQQASRGSDQGDGHGVNVRESSQVNDTRVDAELGACRGVQLDEPEETARNQHDEPAIDQP